MTFEEACEIQRKELAKGGVSNPSHGITEDNLQDYLVAPYRVESNAGSHRIPAWILFRMEAEGVGYAIGVDEEDRDFDFLCYDVIKGEYTYISSYESFIDAVNGI